MEVIEALFATSNSVVLLNYQFGDIFRTNVGFRKGFPLSPVLFNIFRDDIMQNTPQDFNTTMSIGLSRISNFLLVSYAVTKTKKYKFK